MSEISRVTDWSINDVVGLLEDAGFTPARSVELIGSGHWSDCFAFEDRERSLVCRIGNEIEDFEKDRFAGRFNRDGLPVPHVLGIGECGRQYYAISERIFGEPIEQTTAWPQLIDPMADLLEALRATDVSDLTGWGRWDAAGRGSASSWSEFLLRVAHDPPGGRMSGWQEKLAALPAASLAFDDRYDQLQSMASDNVPRALVHNDLYHRNVHTDGVAITGVFDWGISFVGDPLYDLAMLCFWSPWFPGIDEQPLLAELRRRWSADAIVDFGERFSVCMLHTGLEHIGYSAALGHDEQVSKIVARLDVVMTTEW